MAYETVPLGFKPLVAHLDSIVPGKPETYPTYEEMHQFLSIGRFGTTFAESLETQGLTEVTTWTVRMNLPCIGGIIVTAEHRKPSVGFFDIATGGHIDYAWWHKEMQRAQDFDWIPYLSCED